VSAVRTFSLPIRLAENETGFGFFREDIPSPEMTFLEFSKWFPCVFAPYTEGWNISSAKKLSISVFSVELKLIVS
jgi:hypothetical protein